MLEFYPYRLVPYKGLRNPISISKVLDDGYDFGVARRYDGKKDSILKELCLNSGYYVFRDPDAVLTSIYGEIAGLSMMIMGECTNLDDLKYEQKKNAHASWDGKSHSPFSFLGKVSKAKEHFVIVYPVSCLHGQPIEYEKFFSNDTEFSNNKVYIKDDVAEKYLKKFSRKTRYPMKSGQLRVVHVPTMLNYWHVELQLLPASLFEKDMIRNVKYKENRKPENYTDKDLMVRFVWKTYLTQNFTVMENPCKDFPTDYSIDSEISSRTIDFNKCLVRSIYSLIPGIVK